MRGVTDFDTSLWYNNFYFNSHASCEAWQTGIGYYSHAVEISTHTPHARRDSGQPYAWTRRKNFNSHASCEAWRKHLQGRGVDMGISTHTPHARRDWLWAFLINMPWNFNSHASCEAWHGTGKGGWDCGKFQLTRLMRGVTRCCFHCLTVVTFQLTRLMRGVTGVGTVDVANASNFNSHASCEAWPSDSSGAGAVNNFNSHASCEAWLRK